MRYGQTPEPWKLIEVGNMLALVPKRRPPGVKAREVEDICAFCLDDEQHDSRENARRVLACVNACQGIPVEALEAGKLNELIEAAATVWAQTHRPEGALLKDVMVLGSLLADVVPPQNWKPAVGK